LPYVRDARIPSGVESTENVLKKNLCPLRGGAGVFKQAIQREVAKPLLFGRIGGPFVDESVQDRPVEAKGFTAVINPRPFLGECQGPNGSTRTTDRVLYVHELPRADHGNEGTNTLAG
jgi:hypothetical protein